MHFWGVIRKMRDCHVMLNLQILHLEFVLCEGSSAFSPDVDAQFGSNLARDTADHIDHY